MINPHDEDIKNRKTGSAMEELQETVVETEGVHGATDYNSQSKVSERHTDICPDSSLYIR